MGRSVEFVREWKEMGPESEMGAFGVYKKEVSGPSGE